MAKSLQKYTKEQPKILLFLMKITHQNSSIFYKIFIKNIAKNHTKFASKTEAKRHQFLLKIYGA